MAAVLDTSDGAVGLWSALALNDVPGYRLEPVHVVTPRRPHRGSPHLGVVHSSVRFSEADVVRIHGIPVISPAATLIGLVPRLHPAKAADLCDDLLRRRVLVLADLHRAVDALPLRGGNGGYAVLRAIAKLRPEGYRPTDSKLEREFERILEQAGEAPFDRQVDVGDGDGWIGRVDFLDRTLRIVVEVQSATFHTSLSDRHRDAERIARLRAAGWIVVEVTEEEIRQRPSRVLERIRAARALAATRAA
jgi:very-short-patch-repair endonuclease